MDMYDGNPAMSAGHQHMVMDEDLESREKPKVGYICGGKKLSLS